jgi:hypothetical protein
MAQAMFSVRLSALFLGWRREDATGWCSSRPIRAEELRLEVMDSVRYAISSRELTLMRLKHAKKIDYLVIC